VLVQLLITIRPLIPLLALLAIGHALELSAPPLPRRVSAALRRLMPRFLGCSLPSAWLISLVPSEEAASTSATSPPRPTTHDHSHDSRPLPPLASVASSGLVSPPPPVEAPGSDAGELEVDALFADVLGIEASRPFYLIGHSLGGAVAAACVADKEFSRRVAGVSMVDIVEETAVFGLRHMPGFLEKRPPAFESVVAAAKWYVAEGGMKTIDGAMRSVGRTLVAKDESSLTWRTDLAATAGDWEGWFTGMNANFLSTSAPKLLLLANTDRLDKGLTLAMMQGKFQLEVVREAGHHVQEDQPGHPNTKREPPVRSS